MNGKVKCTCGWSWNKSDSSKKDMYVCHECGRDNSNNMKNGGWLDSYEDGGTMQEHQENYNDSSVSLPEGFVGEGYNTKGRNYSPAWGGQFEDGGELIPIAQKGEKIKYVSSENDPRYKSYADSLYNYNLGNKLKGVAKSIPSLVEIKKGSPYDKSLQKTLMKSKNRGLVDNTKNPNSKSIDPRIQALMKEYQKKANKGIKPIRYNSFIDDPDNAAMDIITGRGLTDFIGLTKERSKGYNLPEWKKPKQKVVVDSKTKQNPKPEAQPNKKLNKDPKKEVVQPDLPRVEAINLPPMQQLQSMSAPTTSEVVRSPKSYNVSRKTYNTKGELIDYYTKDEEDVDYERAMLIKSGADAWNRDILKRYGPQNEYRTPKSAADAAERLKQLRSEFEMTPNYQMGGFVYPVNYVPQAQNGKLTFLQPTSEKLPEGYRIPYADPSSELAMSIGGENGEPAYLIPSFKYGKPLYSPIEEFKKTGEHLGGPFKTWQEADKWEQEVRHPAVEKKENIMFPQEQFAMGGSIPGAVGFSYARTNDPAPSNGPYAKKTMASAQNGKEMKYYQEGLDFKPKTISKDGAWLSKYDVAQNGEQIENESSDEEPQFAPITIEEVVIKRNLTNFEKVRNQISKKNKWEDYAQRYLGNFEKNMGQTINNLPEYRKQEYQDYINKLAFDEYIKKYPNAKGEDRGAYIDRIQAENAGSSNFERAYEQNADYNDATDINKWRKFLVGLGSMVVPKPAMDYMKQHSDYYSTKEKQAMRDNPISTYVGDVLSTADILSIPVEGLHSRDKSFGQIASGESADIPMSMRILGDPMMVLGEAAPLLSKGISKGISVGAKALGTEEGLLSNTYKYNPFRFKENPNAYYRQVFGEEASKSPIVTEYMLKNNDPKGIRSLWIDAQPKQQLWNKDEQILDVLELPQTGIASNNALPYFNKGKRYYTNNNFKGKPKEFLLETKFDAKDYKDFFPASMRDVNINPEQSELANKVFGDVRALNPFSKEGHDLSNYNLYKKHWLQGYKEVPLNEASYSIDTPFGFQNRVFDSNIQLGKYNGVGHLSEPGYNYRVLSPKEIEAIKEYKGVFSRPGKQKGGNANVKYWTKGNQKNWYGDKDELETIRVSEANFNPDKVVSSKHVEVYDKETGKFKTLKRGGVIKDDMGQWAHPGEITEIGSPYITMEGVPYDVLGISDTGDTKLMKPGKNYKFKGKKVTEYPMAKNGIRQEQKGLVNLDQLTNFTNYNTKQPGGWLDKY